MAQTISTIAGNGAATSTGDGGQATNASMFPCAVAMDQSGNLFVACGFQNVIRKIDATGVITRFAGTGATGYSGDGGQATSATMNTPSNIVFDRSGNLIVADFGNHVLRKITPSGIISTIAGTGTAGNTGDGGQATNARLSQPQAFNIDRAGNIFISTGYGLRKVNTSGIITTVAGTGAFGYSGDGGQATAATFHGIGGIGFDNYGNTFVTDWQNNRIRKIDASGIVTTVVGNGFGGSSGNGGMATDASITPMALLVDDFGNLFYSSNYALDMGIYLMPADQKIYRIAGDGSMGFSGDGGPATAAQLHNPGYFCFDECGNIYVPDAGNYRVRKLSFPGCNYLKIDQDTRKLEENKVYYDVGNKTIIFSLSEKYNYAVFDATGIVRMRGVIETNNEQLDVKCFSPGLYVIQINSPKGNSNYFKITL